MTTIHYHYEMLTKREREFVDDVFNTIFPMAIDANIQLVADDRIERVVDALARAVTESRKQ